MELMFIEHFSGSKTHQITFTSLKEGFLFTFLREISVVCEVVLKPGHTREQEKGNATQSDDSKGFPRDSVPGIWGNAGSIFKDLLTINPYIKWCRKKTPIYNPVYCTSHVTLQNYPL